MNTRIAIDNKVVDKEPAGRLIDKRFAKVNDWEKEENNSSIKGNTTNISILVKKGYNGKEHNTNPKDQTYNNPWINTTIIPKG